MGVFNTTIILLALVGYEMIIAISYPTRPRGIIVNYYSSEPNVKSFKYQHLSHYMVPIDLINSLNFTLFVLVISSPSCARPHKRYTLCIIPGCNNLHEEILLEHKRIDRRLHI